MRSEVRCGYEIPEGYLVVLLFLVCATKKTEGCLKSEGL